MPTPCQEESYMSHTKTEDMKLATITHMCGSVDAQHAWCGKRAADVKHEGGVMTTSWKRVDCHGCMYDPAADVRPCPPRYDMSHTVSSAPMPATEVRHAPTCGWFTSIRGVTTWQCAHACPAWERGDAEVGQAAPSTHEVGQAPISPPVVHAMCATGYNTPCGARLADVNMYGDHISHKWDLITCRTCLTYMVGFLTDRLHIHHTGAR